MRKATLVLEAGKPVLVTLEVAKVTELSPSQAAAVEALCASYLLVPATAEALATAEEGS